MRLHLRRFAEFGEDGLFGELNIGGWRCFTLERRWRDNLPFISCIPAGTYELRLHEDGRHAGTWALVGGTVSYEKDREFPRYCILIHPANFAYQLAGCIAPGLSLGYLKDRRAILSSGAAMRYVLGYLDWDTTHDIFIEDKMGGWEG